jgi:hypothetical protein
MGEPCGTEVAMPPLDTDYWLGHCQGFRVDSPEGRVGRVDDVLFRSRLERPDALLVRSGVLGTQLVSVSVDEVVGITPRKEQLRLRHRPNELRQRRNERSHLLTKFKSAGRLGHSSPAR